MSKDLDIAKKNKLAVEIFAAFVVGFALLLLVGGLVGCKTQYVEGVMSERIVEVHHHDTTIVIEADSASAIALLECDSAYNIVLRELTIDKGKRIVPRVKTEHFADVNKMQLEFDCREDSLLNVIAWQDSVISTMTSQTIVRVEKRKDFVYYCGVAFIAIICLVFVWNVAKVVLKFYGLHV